MKTKQWSKLQIIEDTVNYYSKDTSRRAVCKETKECEYLTSDGKKCAISRYMNNKADRKYQGDYKGYVKYYNITADEHLVPRVKGHSLMFYRDLQDLHDSSKYWDKKGLTYSGVVEVERLKQLYA